MIQGKNVKKLIARKMSIDVIPPGGNFESGIKFLLNRQAIINAAKVATDWVRDVIQAVRQGAEPNKYKQADDEAIAAAILKRIEENDKSEEMLEDEWENQWK